MDATLQSSTTQSLGNIQTDVSSTGIVDFSQPHKMIDVGHSQLAYWQVGKGPDLLFIHGWPVHSATFRHLLPLMAEHFTCHLVDLPFVGKTISSRETPCGFENCADTLCNAIDQLGLTRYSIVSHDSGGVVARYLASKRPESVVGLVISDTEIPNYQSPLLLLLLAVGKLPGGMWLLMTSLRIRAIRHSLFGFGSAFHNKQKIDDFFELFGRPLIKSKTLLKGQQKVLQNVSIKELNRLAKVHQQIKVPVKLLWGQQDPYFPVNEAEKMVKQFAGRAEIHVFNPGKLFIHEEFPQRYAEHAMRFLKSL